MVDELKAGAEKIERWIFRILLEGAKKPFHAEIPEETFNQYGRKKYNIR